MLDVKRVAVQLSLRAQSAARWLIRRRNRFVKLVTQARLREIGWNHCVESSTDIPAFQMQSTIQQIIALTQNVQNKTLAHIDFVRSVLCMAPNETCIDTLITAKALMYFTRCLGDPDTSSHDRTNIAVFFQRMCAAKRYVLTVIDHGVLSAMEHVDSKKGWNNLTVNERVAMLSILNRIAAASAESATCIVRTMPLVARMLTKCIFETLTSTEHDQMLELCATMLQWKRTWSPTEYHMLLTCVSKLACCTHLDASPAIPVLESIGACTLTPIVKYYLTNTHAASTDIVMFGHTLKMLFRCMAFLAAIDFVVVVQLLLALITNEDPAILATHAKHMQALLAVFFRTCDENMLGVFFKTLSAPTFLSHTTIQWAVINGLSISRPFTSCVVALLTTCAVDMRDMCFERLGNSRRFMSHLNRQLTKCGDCQANIRMELYIFWHNMIQSLMARGVMFPDFYIPSLYCYIDSARYSKEAMQV